jgi:hypothetical protein
VNTEVEVTKQRVKIHRLASGFSKDFSNLGLAHGFLPRNLGFIFASHKHLTKALDFRLADIFHEDFKFLGSSGFSS